MDQSKLQKISQGDYIVAVVVGGVISLRKFGKNWATFHSNICSLLHKTLRIHKLRICSYGQI